MSSGIQVVGIVGAGAMGRGIAQLAAVGGVKVLLFDMSLDAAKEGLSHADAMIRRSAEKGRLTEDASLLARSRLSVAPSLEDLAAADLVVEAIIERLDSKVTLLTELEAIVSDSALLATNTSSLSVTEIASYLSRPERFLGMHFFNPAPLMKLVEVIPGVRTASPCVERVSALVESWGYRSVQVLDSPGFLVNHMGRAYVTEALRMLEECVATPETVDRVMRLVGGFRMGPFELMDLTGLDVTHPATEAIYTGFYQEPRLKPSYITRKRHMAGLFGRKSGSGFYHYGDKNRESETTVSLGSSKRVSIGSVWIDRSTLNAENLEAAMVDAGLTVSTDPSPGSQDVLIIADLGNDATGASASKALDPARVLMLDPFSLSSDCWTFSLPLGGNRQLARQLTALMTKSGREFVEIGQSVGLVFQRVICSVINLACDVAQQGIASPEDIDAGAKLALGYPKGPLEWGDSLGVQNVLLALEGIHSRTGDARYRPSLWLRRRAEAGHSLRSV